MTCPRRGGSLFPLAPLLPNFSRHLPSHLPSPCPPPAAVVCRSGAPAAAGGGSFIFSKGGRCGHRPPFAPPRGIFLPGGAMRKFWRGGGSSRSFFPPSAHPLPPPAAVVCRSGALTAAGGGFFCFFKRGTMWPSPPFASPRGTFLPGGAMRKFWRGGGSCRSFFPPSAHPLPPPAAVVFRRGAPAAAGGGSFIFSKGGRCGHRPPFASPRGIFLPGGAMRKFWRGGTWFFHLPCPGMRKARKPMLPGFCVTPNSRSSSSPSAGSCGRCAPPWGRCPGSTAPGRPCRR